MASGGFGGKGSGRIFRPTVTPAHSLVDVAVSVGASVPAAACEWNNEADTKGRSVLVDAPMHRETARRFCVRRIGSVVEGALAADALRPE